MTCKDCINYSSCLERGDVAPKELMEGAEDDCELFKNKSGYAEVVHGEWVWTETGDEDYEQYWICSVCGEKDYIKSKYCPECGADMRRRSEDDG